MEREGFSRAIKPPRVPRALTTFLKPYDPAIRTLALALRQIVIDELAPCHESLYDAYSAVAIGIGTSDRLKDGIVHIAVYRDHVNLGFNFGAYLPDPAGVFKGTGSQVRHIPIATPDDLRSPAIRRYLRAARREAGKPRRRPGSAATVVSTVKRIYERKLRPR